MAVPVAFRVLSQTPVVVEDAGFPISYQPGAVFFADPQNASVMRLLMAGKVVPVVGASATPTEGFTIVAGPPGPDGPVGPVLTDFTVVARTANTLLTTADKGTLNTNTGATIDIVLTLPAWSVGARYLFAVTAAHYLRINNLDGTTAISLGTSTGLAGGFVRSNVPISILEIIGVASGKWGARVNGNWTVDA